MKLRIRANSVRLRLSDDEVVRIGRGDSIVEQTRFSGGVFAYRLEIGGDEISARFTSGFGIEIKLPEQQAIGWATSSAVSLHGAIEVDGETLSVLIEKDLKPDKG